MTRDEYGIAFEANFDCTVRILKAHGLRPEDALDVAQEAWARGWKYLSQLRHKDCVVAWVSAIALRTARDFVISRKREHQLCADDAKVGSYRQNLTSLLDATRALDKCTPAYRLILHQLYVMGYSEKELAERSNRTATAVRGQAYRARQAMRGLLLA